MTFLGGAVASLLSKKEFQPRFLSRFSLFEIVDWFSTNSQPEKGFKGSW